MTKYTASGVADVFLAFCNEYGDLLTNLKLQKMLYYAQGWHLGLYGTPLFDDVIEAWIHGPVVPEVYRRFKPSGHKPIDSPARLVDQPEDLVVHIKDVWEAYGGLSAYDLERLSHAEAPWRNARVGLTDDAPCQAAIKVEDMKRFFESKLVHG